MPQLLRSALGRSPSANLSKHRRKRRRKEMTKNNYAMNIRILIAVRSGLVIGKIIPRKRSKKKMPTAIYRCKVKPDKRTMVNYWRNTKGRVHMNNATKAIIIIVVLIYVISPVDAMPGPLDDIIVILMGLGAAKGGTSGDG